MSSDNSMEEVEVMVVDTYRWAIPVGTPVPDLAEVTTWEVEAGMVAPGVTELLGLAEAGTGDVGGFNRPRLGGGFCLTKPL